jgi:hypothetical protein
MELHNCTDIIISSFYLVFSGIRFEGHITDETLQKVNFSLNEEQRLLKYNAMRSGRNILLHVENVGCSFPRLTD